MKHAAVPLWNLAFGALQFVYSCAVAATIALGKWPISAALVAAVAAIPAFFIESATIVSIMLIGSTTVFIFANNFIRDIPGASIEHALFLLLAAKFVAGSAFNKARNTAWLRAEFAIVAYLVILGLASVHWILNDRSEWKSDLALYLDGFIVPLAGFILMRRMNWNETRVLVLLQLMVLVGIYQAALGTAGLFIDLSMFKPAGQEIYTVFSSHAERATGTFTNATEYGAVIATFDIVALLLYTRSRDSLERVAMLAAMGLMTTALILSQTRGPWVGFFVMLVYLYWFERRVRPVLTAATIIGTITIIVALPFVLQSDTIERVSAMGPVFQRIAVWVASLNLSTDYFFTGIGLGSRAYVSNSLDYAVSVGIISLDWVDGVSQPHNEFLSALVATGVAGFALYIFILYSLLRQCMALAAQHGRDGLAGNSGHFLVAVLLNLIVNALVVDLRFFVFFNLLTFALVAIIFALADREKSATQLSLPATHHIRFDSSVRMT